MALVRQEESAETRSKLAKGRNRGTMFKMLLSLAQQDVMHRGHDALENADVEGDLKEARTAGGFVHRRRGGASRKRRRRKSRSSTIASSLKSRARPIRPGRQLETFLEDQGEEEERLGASSDVPKNEGGAEQTGNEKKYNSEKIQRWKTIVRDDTWRILQKGEGQGADAG